MQESKASTEGSSCASTDAEESLLLRAEHVDFENDYKPDNRRHRTAYPAWVFPVGGAVVLFSLCVNLILTAILVIRSGESKFGTFENGFSTDMEPAKLAMEAVRMPFTGELKRNANGTLYRDMPGPQYFGPPSQEIEDNWAQLVYASGLDLNEEEITQTGLKDTTWQEPQGGLWRTGLDVFHQLHCLNMIRKSFDTEYFEKEHDGNIDDPPRLRNMHRDHCLDYIRQALMCNADATPVRLQWDYQAHFLIPKFDQLHTCRNFELLHAWSRARALEKHHDESKKLIDEMRESGAL